MTDDLDILRPEVREALIDFDSWMNSHEYHEGVRPRRWFKAIRAELLRLAKIEKDYGFAIDCERRRADEAEAELAEMKQTFDLRWKADMRAIEQWRAAHSSKELTWPDHADLCVWLLGELAALKADHAALQELCDATVRANLALGHVKEEWQPISTAPHEQLVLLFCPYRHPSNPQRIEVGAATWGERVGQRSNRGAHAWATHWMPLPPPPKGEE